MHMGALAHLPPEAASAQAVECPPRAGREIQEGPRLQPPVRPPHRLQPPPAAFLVGAGGCSDGSVGTSEAPWSSSVYQGWPVFPEHVQYPSLDTHAHTRARAHTRRRSGDAKQPGAGSHLLTWAAGQHQGRLRGPGALSPACSWSLCHPRACHHPPAGCRSGWPGPRRLAMHTCARTPRFRR